LDWKDLRNIYVYYNIHTDILSYKIYIIQILKSIVRTFISILTQRNTFFLLFSYIYFIFLSNCNNKFFRYVIITSINLPQKDDRMSKLQSSCNILTKLFCGIIFFKKICKTDKSINRTAKLKKQKISHENIDLNKRKEIIILKKIQSARNLNNILFSYIIFYYKK